MNRFIPFSKKQLAVLNWWCNGSDVKNKNGIICDGAVRSGKTLCMGISFICWSFYAFCDTSFAICGKTERVIRIRDGKVVEDYINPGYEEKYGRESKKNNKNPIDEG